jgi:hypothetical protein
MQLLQTRAGEHQARGLDRIGREDVRRVRADRAGTAIRQSDHEQQHTVPAFEPRRLDQLTEQRMRRCGHPHAARQHRTQMLQSFAITVGVGKTHLATALGHIAVRRRRTVRFLRADQMFRTLKAARLDNSVAAEMRALARVEVLIPDDLALQAMHATETSDFYELIVERHQKTSTIVTSNRDPSEWIAVMSDPLLAQSAVDRLVSTSYELVIEGESYRRRQRPQPTGASKTPH